MQNYYFVIYDLNENYPIYIDDIIELTLFTGLRVKDINYKFKKSNDEYIKANIDNTLFKIYRYC